MTLDDALARARQRAPVILAARAQIEEARGRLLGASALLRHNPQLEVSGGPRVTDDGTTADAAGGLRQTFELGGQREARIAGAGEDIARAIADSENAARRLLREVAIAFCRALCTRDRAHIAAAAGDLAAELLRVAERRQHAGEVTALDVNLARAAHGRARSDGHAAAAAHQAALGELRLLLGLDVDEPLDIQGDLRDRRRFDLQSLAARAPMRPDLQGLEAEVRRADADRRLGEAARWPDLGIGVQGGRLDGDPAVIATMTVTIPIFEHGQGRATEAAARTARHRLELESGRRAVGVEVRTAYDVYRRRVEAAEAIEQDALPVLDENEALARRSYEVGQIGLGELLLIRREILETRGAYLERLLDAAIAGVDLEASAGALR